MMDRSEIESARIKKGKCPECGADMKDKGTYMRCTSCTFSVTNGVWSEEEGYAIERGFGECGNGRHAIGAR